MMNTEMHKKFIIESIRGFSWGAHGAKYDTVVAEIDRIIVIGQNEVKKLIDELVQSGYVKKEGNKLTAITLDVYELLEGVK